MNKLKSMASGCVLAMTLTPLNAAAATSQTALDACASALVADLSSARGVAMEYSLGDSLKAPRYRLDNSERFHLDVLDPRTSEVVARADCWVDSRARVRKITEVPLDAGDAEERAVTAR